jgi:hypothetical protein
MSRILLNHRRESEQNVYVEVIHRFAEVSSEINKQFIKEITFRSNQMHYFNYSKPKTIYNISL